MLGEGGVNRGGIKEEKGGRGRRPRRGVEKQCPGVELFADHEIHDLNLPGFSFSIPPFSPSFNLHTFFHCLFLLSGNLTSRMGPALGSF